MQALHATCRARSSLLAIVTLVLAVSQMGFVHSPTKCRAPLVARARGGHLKGEPEHSHGHHETDANSKMLGGDVTPLMQAAHEGDLESVAKLLASEENVDQTDNFGWTALRFAARNGHADVVEALMAKGADKDSTSATGRTPLMSAAGNGHEQVVRLLIDSGADALATDKDGMTAYFLALRGEGTDNIKDLVRAG
eukprot:TRINITY_DN3775_c0_g1_i1.p1 TRINITY_DN3775_c0_g1~~TRINITY_DN3775_c0_g1_i1.p1  ORF type:complete len:195 (+),score=32.44 TRINITY_DN3775_c0_g1_i1:75-659(+)